jgi:hypothetical protein
MARSSHCSPNSLSRPATGGAGLIVTCNSQLSRNSLQVVDFIDLICNGPSLAQAVVVCGDVPAKGTSCSPNCCARRVRLATTRSRYRSS